MVTAPVGTFNLYEYTTSYTNTTIENGYLNIGYNWWIINPYGSETNVAAVLNVATIVSKAPTASKYGIRPVINLKPTVEIVGGSGTQTDPYRLAGDNDTPESGTLLNTRYSGEYVKFNNEDYRIVNVENMGGNLLTKLVKVDCIKSSGTYVSKKFGITTDLYSESVSNASTNYIGRYLNDTSSGWYSTLSTSSKNMIQEATWYIGRVDAGQSYKKGICETVNTLSSGELEQVVVQKQV